MLRNLLIIGIFVLVAFGILGAVQRGARSDPLKIVQETFCATVVVLNVGMRGVCAAMILEIELSRPGDEFLSGIGSVSYFVEEVFKR